MNSSAPSALGRGIVVRAGHDVPSEWETARRVSIDAETTADPAARSFLADRLHRSWANREPVVVEWDVADDVFADLEHTRSAPWSLDAGFLFPNERLRFLCFSNNYDARSGDLTWWWTVKAGRIGAHAGGSRDVVLADGREVWIDGGPRGPLPDGVGPVVHGESVEAETAGLVPAPMALAETGLAADQAEAAGHGAGAARIIAPAGSGKTRTLAARLRHLLDGHAVEPSLAMAVAYNRRAADELRDRLGIDRSMVRTIHSLGWAILREARPGLELIDEIEVRNLFNGLVSVPHRANADPIGPYLEALQTVRSGLSSPASVEAGRDDITGFAAAFEPLRERMYGAGRVDHGEQVYGAVEALLRDPGLRRRWQMRCRHLLVDEFQDLTPAYLLLLRLVASPELAVFGVGDDDQVIYGHDGADPAFLIDYESYFPGAGTHDLHVNYRCAPQIVEATVNLLSHNGRRIAKDIRAGRLDERTDALTVAKREGLTLALDGADQIAGWIENGVAPHDIAVLSRVNASLISIKAALVTRDIPTNDIVTRRALDRTMVRALQAWVLTASDPSDISRDRAFEMIRRPPRRLTRMARELLPRRTDLDGLRKAGIQLDQAAAERWAEFCDDVAAAAKVAATGDVGDLIRYIVYDVGLGNAARQLDSGRSHAARPGHFDDLVAIERAAAVHPEVEDFFAWLRSTLDRASDPTGVTLSSVHRVKGMEWSHVLVFGADRGTMPHDLSDDIEEERRVFHVAITRGIDRVAVLADAGRPSRFIGELERRAEPPAPAPQPAPRMTGPGRAGRDLPSVGDEIVVSGGYRGEVVAIEESEIVIRLDTGAEMGVGFDDVLAHPDDAGPTAAPDAELVERLRVWRLETSRRDGVPAYVVFNNATLDEIAAKRPATERELLAISGIGPKKLEDYGDDILEIILESGE